MAGKTQKELTPTLRRFVEEYHKTGKGGPSWTAAGYKAKGNAAEVKASQALKRPEVSAYLRTLEGEQKARSDWDKDKLIEFFGDMVRSGQVAPRDRISAAKEIGRMIGAYEEDNKQVADPLLQLMREIRDRQES